MSNKELINSIKYTYATLNELSSSLGERNRDQNLDATFHTVREHEEQFKNLIKGEASQKDYKNHYYDFLKPNIDIIQDYATCNCNKNVMLATDKLILISREMEENGIIDAEVKTKRNIKKYSQYIYELLPNWLIIRSIQNNKIVQSTYIYLLILPILAKFMSNIEDKVKIEIYNQVIILDMQLPFTWKALFISALLFTLANIIYLIKCPKIIKENKNYGEFLEKGRDQGHLEGYMNSSQWKEWKNINSGTIREVILGKRNSSLIAKNITDPSLGSEQDIIKTKVLTSQFFWKIHEEADNSKFLSRMLEAILYGFAGLIFMYIMLQNIIYVIQQF